MSQKINDRDIAIFKHLHQNKVATTKHLLESIFKVASGTARRRLTKLRRQGLIKALCRDEEGDKSIVYSLSKKSFNVLQRIYPDEFHIKRFKSNSIAHDLRLLEIQNVLRKKKMVSGYWTENTLQSSIDLQMNLKLSAYIDLQVDGVIRLGENPEEYFYCGLEYEASLKSQSEYARKIASIYLNPRIEAILYITKNQKIEKRIKKTELEEVPKGEKKIYFTQLEKVTNETSVVTFVSQENNFLEIY